MKDVPLILCVCNTPKRNLSDRDEEQQYIKQMKDKRYQDVIKKKVANQYKQTNTWPKNKKRDKDYKIKVSKHETRCQNQERTKALRKGERLSKFCSTCGTYRDTEGGSLSGKFHNNSPFLTIGS